MADLTTTQTATRRHLRQGQGGGLDGPARPPGAEQNCVIPGVRRRRRG
ncbi:hypothetical protein [Actinomyces trachealis]|nr:hypothetical protein [Actinomyces trachealis]